MEATDPEEVAGAVVEDIRTEGINEVCEDAEIDHNIDFCNLHMQCKSECCIINLNVTSLKICGYFDFLAIS